MLALQEVDVRLRRSGRADLASVVARATGLRHVFGTAHRVGWRGRYGNALLVRGEILDSEVLGLPRIGGRRGERRSAVLASVALDGRELSVAATHLSIHPREAGGQLAVVLEALLHRPLPRLLIGDLNLRPPDIAWRVRAAGLTLASGLPTFPAAAPRLRIDHVAAGGLHLGPVSTPATPVSDHRPLVVDADWSGES